jgi:enoyl-CoA hydratase/carnithine racemase
MIEGTWLPDWDGCRYVLHGPMPDVDYRLDRSVAVITFSNPPVNGLSHAVRAGIGAAFERALADPSVNAVVLTGAGGLFSAGADIREFDTPASTAEPALPRLLGRIETSAKPVVAAIAGVCLGGGLELALAAHYRVASADANLGLPEVKLGLIPGGRHPAAAAAGRGRTGAQHDRERRAGCGVRAGGHRAARPRPGG